MTRVTIIGADETCEAADFPHAFAADQFISDQYPGHMIDPDWTRYDGRRCEVWRDPRALDLNLDATALYLVAHGDIGQSHALDDFKLFGPIAIVQETK